MPDTALLIRQARVRLLLAGWHVEAHQSEAPGGGTVWCIRATHGGRVVVGEAATPASVWAEAVFRAAIVDAVAHRPWRPGSGDPRKHLG